MFDDQRPKKVLVDEEIIKQLLNHVQMSGQTLVPRRIAAPDEYRIQDAETEGNDDVEKYVNNAPEINLNRNRNQILDETFGI